MFAAGQVVLLPFPFSDLSRTKYRPAFLLASAGRQDWIACQVTSRSFADARARLIESKDFKTGMLPVESYARTGKLFTANEGIFTSILGEVTDQKFSEISDSVISLLLEARK